MRRATLRGVALAGRRAPTAARPARLHFAAAAVALRRRDVCSALLRPAPRLARRLLWGGATLDTGEASDHTGTSYSVEDVCGWLHSELGSDVSALDTRGMAGGGSMGEHLVFATATSKAHMSRIAKAVQHELKHRGVVMFDQAPTIEGRHSDDWLLVDGGSVVVSVLTRQARERLSLESHWLSLGATLVELPAEIFAPPEVPQVSPISAEAAAQGRESLGLGYPAAPPTHWGGVPGDPDPIYSDETVAQDATLSDEALAWLREAEISSGAADADEQVDKFADEYAGGSTEDGEYEYDYSSSSFECEYGSSEDSSEYYYDEGSGWSHHDEGEPPPKGGDRA